MVIRNLEKQYRVIREWEGQAQDGIIQYICREEKEQRDCRLARQELKSVSGDQIRFFMDQIHSEAFTDFLDFFTDSNYLYLVMAHPEGESLAGKLEESCSLKERMEIGKNLLENMILLNLPEYFFQSAMDLRLITVSRSLEVRLGYDLSGLERFREYGFEKGARKLAAVLSALFKEELDIRAFPPMETLIYDLGDNRFESLLEIYGRFQELYREWADRKEEQLRPESFSFRLWERIKQAGRLLKRLAAAGVLGLALLYLAVSVMEARKEPGYADNYDSIGTLEIQRPSDPQAEVQAEALGE